jgi:hypothetical protein
LSTTFRFLLKNVIIPPPFLFLLKHVIIPPPQNPVAEETSGMYLNNFFILRDGAAERDKVKPNIPSRLPKED